MIRIFVYLFTLLAASSAHALSCVPVYIAQSYQDAAASEKRYIAVLGVFSFDENALPKTTFDSQDSNPDTFISTTFNGRSLTRRGFTNDFQTELTINFQCFGPWCASLKSGLTTLAFVEKQDDGYLLPIDPCGGFVFQDPPQKYVDQVVACHQGRKCNPKRSR